MSEVTGIGGGQYIGYRGGVAVHWGRGGWVGGGHRIGELENWRPLYNNVAVIMVSAAFN